MTWFFFALATPILFSASNFVDKFLVSKKLPNPLLLTVIASLITGLIGLLMGFIVGFQPLSPTELILLALAGVFLSLYAVPYFYAMKQGDASHIASLFQFIPIFSIILSAIFLNEFLIPKVILGFIFIFTGGLILSMEKLDLSFFKPRPSLLLMLLSCFIYALANILFRSVARSQSFWPSLYYELIGMGLGGLILFLFIKEKKILLSQIHELKSVVSIVCLGDGFSIPARITNSYALSLAPASFVMIVGNSQPLWLLLYGIVLSLWFPKIIKEDISHQTIGKKLVNITLILTGLALIYF